MLTSNSIKSISEALVGFHNEVAKIPKDAKNPFFKSKYASLSGILDAISVPLVNNGLAVVQFPEGENGLTTRLCHTSGEWMEATYSMRPAKDDPQGRGSAITYQRRYAIGAILSLNIDEDDDANAASKPVVNGNTGKITIKEAGKQQEEIKQAVKDLLDCKNIEDLKKLKSQLPDYVLNNESFKEHGNSRYKELSQLTKAIA